MSENELFVPTRGSAKIQLLSSEAMFGQNGIWHAKDEAELAAAFNRYSSTLYGLMSERHLSDAVKRKLQDALEQMRHGKIERGAALGLVPLLNSAALRTGGSSTMNWTVWKARRGKGVKLVKPKAFSPLGDVPQADVYVEVGGDLFNPMRETTEKITSAVIGTLDETKRRYPKARLVELRELAAQVAKEGVFKPRTRAGLKVDYKLVQLPSGETKLALIDVSTQLAGVAITDKHLASYGLPSELASSLAHSFLNMHAEETGKLPRNVAIMVRDSKILRDYREDLEIFKRNVERILLRRDPEAQVAIVLQQSVERRAEAIMSARHRGRPVDTFKVQTVDNKSMIPDLIIRRSRFPLEGEAGELLEQFGINTLDRSHHVLVADKTVNANVLTAMKLEPTGKIIVPRRMSSTSSVFSNEYEGELDAALERARVESWSGLVVKLPTKLAAGKSQREEVTAHFVNPNSPLQIDALKQTLAGLRERGRNLPEDERRKAKLVFEELVISSLPQLQGRGVELRTISMPRFKVTRVQKIVSPAG